MVVHDSVSRRLKQTLEHTPARSKRARGEKQDSGQWRVYCLQFFRAIPFTSGAASPMTLSAHRRGRRIIRARFFPYFRERGWRGVLGSELYNQPLTFGRSPRNRISELRKEGFDIKGEPRGGSDWHYWLDNSKIQRLESWQDRPRVTGLPLFDSVHR